MYDPSSSVISPEFCDTFPSAYTIDDGKGDLIHVNVSNSFAILKLEHSRHFKGQLVSCVHYIDRSGFTMIH